MGFASKMFICTDEGYIGAPWELFMELCNSNLGDYLGYYKRRLSMRSCRGDSSIIFGICGMIMIQP
jgi:hypothetical protein